MVGALVVLVVAGGLVWLVVAQVKRARRMRRAGVPISTYGRTRAAIDAETQEDLEGQARYRERFRNQ